MPVPGCRTAAGHSGSRSWTRSCAAPRRLFQIEGEVYDERVWDSFGVTRPATDPERMLHRFTVWCPQPHLGRLYRGELSRSGNVRVLLHATATGIGTSADGTAFDHVRVATREGPQRAGPRAHVRAERRRDRERPPVARLPDVGNRHDLVGRYFQDHPNSHCAVIAPRAGARLQDLYAMLYRRGTRYLPRLVLSERVQEQQGVLSCAAYPVFHFGEEVGNRGVAAHLPRGQQPPPARGAAARSGPPGA